MNRLFKLAPQIALLALVVAAQTATAPRAMAIEPASADAPAATSPNSAGGSDTPADSPASGGSDSSGTTEPATNDETDHPTSWWNWWSGLFGMSFDSVSYGSGSGRVIGSDKLVHQLRTISGVKGIELRGPIDIVIKQGQVEKLTLHTDDNIAPLIDTGVTDGVLHLGVVPGASFRTKHPVGATVEIRNLTSLKILGSGDVTCAQLDTDLFEITVRGSGDVRIDTLHTPTLAVLVQGSGDVRLAGNAPKQGIVIEGSGNVTTGDLSGRDVAVRIAGSGDAEVRASDTLAVDIAGSGDVVYHGQAKVTKSVHGSGDVAHR
jgi:hypothetical protein